MELKERLSWLPALERSTPGLSQLGGALATVAPPLEPARRVGRATSEQLGELRARIASLIDATRLSPRTAPAPQLPPLAQRQVPRSRPETTTLPFVLHETALGKFYRRLQCLPRGQHFGHVDLSLAWSASSKTLAQLALDEALLRSQPARALYLDTETTGLGLGAGTFAFLVGLAYFDDAGQLWLEQLLLDSPSEEPALVQRLGELVDGTSLIISYNGKSYDWPLLESRCVMTRRQQLPKRPHLDLLHVARRLHRSRLREFRLKRIEQEVLGFVRDADIDGSEVGPRYHHFLRTGDEEALRGVVDHNAWDLLGMVAMVGVYAEPLQRLGGSDLVDLARVYQRAGDLESADRAALCALSQGWAAPALAVRGRLAKARGDRAAAQSHFESSLAHADDPSVRLELAKLYEHHAKDPRRALSVMPHAGAETEASARRREARLRAKLAERN